MNSRARTVWGLLLLAGMLVTGGVFLMRHYPLWLVTQVVRFHLWRSDVRSRYVQVGNYRLHYYEAEPPGGEAGTPLVLVHGLGARGEDWSPMIPGLAASGFHVYAPDLLGYGRSARPDVDYSIALEERTTAEFMRAVGVGRADVAGWSMGGWVTMALAVDQPELVDRVVVYDSAGVYFQPTYDFSVFTPRDTAGVTELLHLLIPNPPVLPRFVAEDVVRTLGRNAWVVRRSVVAMAGGKDLLDFRLSGLRQPMLVVWGEQDRLIPLSSGETIHRLVAGSVLAVQPGCGHLAPAQCSGPILRETVQFLRATPPARGGEVRLAAAK